MDKRLLESFVSVHRTGSLVEAAERLNISQSALSRRVTELQTRLGTVLFRPSGRGIAATPEAHRLLPFALNALEAMTSFEAAAKMPNVPEPVHLTIAATAHTLEGLVAERIVGLMRSRPNYMIHFQEAGGVEIEDLVVSGKITLGLTARPRFDTGLADQPVARLNMLAVSAEPFSPAEVENGIELTALCARGLIMLDRRYQSRVTIDAALRLLQLSARVVHEASSAALALGLARAGLGTAIVPSSARTFIPSTRICVHGIELGMDLVAIWDPTKPGRTEAEQLAFALASPVEDVSLAYSGLSA